MTSISTKTCNDVRHTADDTIRSLNIRIDNNSDEYVVVIVGIHEHRYILENIPKFISKDCIQSFDDIQTSLTFIYSLSNMNIFLIISDRWDQDHIRKLECKSQNISISIHIINDDKHLTWTKEIENIQCTILNLKRLQTQLYADIKELIGRWSLSEKSFRKTATSDSQWYHLFLLVICYRSQYIKESYKEMVDESRVYYKNNPSMLEKIDKFAYAYEPNNAICEYTKNSFVYRIVNHALRTQNMEIIRKFSPYIRDLHSQLHDYHQKYCRSNEHSIRSVYRGQHMSEEELEYLRSLCKSRNSIITLTTFASASLNPEVAMIFAAPVKDRIACLFEIIITDEYFTKIKNRGCHEQAFVNISSLSTISDEQEVLFSLVTHFRVKYVGNPVNEFNQSWVPIVLELVRNEKDQCGYNYFSLINRIEKDTNQQTYNDILHVLEVNAADELKFNSTNWKKWWIDFTKKLTMGPARNQPLILTLYDCFTEDKYLLRKAVEMYKDVLHSIPEVQSNSSSPLYLFKEFKIYHETPTKQIALYEDYLKKLCDTNTEEVIKCLWCVGQTYEIIVDQDHALECYQTALNIDVDNKYQMKQKIEKQIKTLTKPVQTRPMMNNKGVGLVTNDTDKRLSQIYEAEEEQWTIYWNINGTKANNIDIESILSRLKTYLTVREQWYDAADSKIVLRLPYENNEKLTIDNYQFYFWSAVQAHMSPSMLMPDTTNHRSLCLWRCEKYMRDLALFKRLKRFLQPFERKSWQISDGILLQLDQLVAKLRVLTALCTIYICIEHGNDVVNVNNVQFINRTNINTKQLIFFDLRNNDLLTGLQALEEKGPITEVSDTMSKEFPHLFQ